VDLPQSRNPPHLAEQQKATPNDGSFGVALLLAGLAGWVDAAGLADSSGVFLSFMSGNTTDLATSLARHDWSQAGTIAAVLVLFVAGVIMGELLDPLGGRFGPSLVLGVEALLLAGGAELQLQGLASPTFRLFPLVFAMGLQNATMHRAGGIGIGLTYVTGTLVQIGRALASMLKGATGARRLLQYLTLWLSLAGGAASGALAMSVSLPATLLFAAAVAASLAITTAISQTINPKSR
jgi:uncharacterized membrane protein YoaK (UPF0700 family)